MYKAVLALALLLLASVLVGARPRKGPALDKWYINRAKEFHAQWAKEEGVLTLESGLQYKVIEKSKQPNAAHPTPADTVALRFQVFIPDEDPPGRIMIGNNVYFDEETEEWKGLSTVFKMASVLEGWRRGLELMSEGDHWELYIPYQMAYGGLGRADTRPAVPVFSPLILNVWLDKINPPEPEKPAEKPEGEDAKAGAGKAADASSQDKGKGKGKGKGKDEEHEEHEEL